MLFFENKKLSKLIFTAFCLLLIVTLMLSFVHTHPYDEAAECLTCEFLFVLRGFFGFLALILPLLYFVASLIRLIKRRIITHRISVLGLDLFHRSVRLNN